MRTRGTVSGAAANLAAQGLPFLLLIVVTPILLDALGRERYGALVLFNLVPQIAGQLDLGLSTVAARAFTQYVARADRAGARRLFREASLLLVGWGCVLAALFYVAHNAVAHALKLDTVVADGAWTWVAAAVAIPLALANSASLVPLRALERYGVVARIQVIAGVAYWVACAFWAPRGGTLTDLVVLGTASVALSTVTLYVVGIEDSGAASSSASAPSTDGAWLLRPFLKIGAGAFVAQASSLATYHADKLLVSALISPAAAGGYAICTSIANKILLVVASSATFTFPRSAQMHALGRHDAVAEVFANTTRVALLIATCSAVALVAIGPRFLELWIGPAFAEDFGWTLRILAFGYAVAACSVVASNVAVGIGEVVLPAVFAVAGGAITLVGVWLLAPRYGAAGAAAAAAIGMAQATLFNDLLARRLGAPAHRASWPLLGRLAAIAVPVGVAAAAASALIVGWTSLLLLGTATVLVFAWAWWSAFASIAEHAILRQFRDRVRHVLDHH